jgi:eukaryotic-like serine/threonine-protein kinase
MPSAPSDLNMLFGMLALQLDFISKDHLLAAMHVWMHDKSKSLSQILADQKVLADDRRQLLDALVLKHLEQHNNDLHESLAALSPRSSAQEIFEGLGDSDVDRSIQRVRELRDEAPDPDETPSWSESGPTRFRILRPHAQGGLGIVYVAWDQEVGREVALKEIQERHGKNADTRARFVQEAEITGALEHPGIVPVYGLGQYSDGRPYYAMRFIKGNSLKEAVNAFHQADVAGRDPTERSLALRQLLRRFIDVCNAIEYAHSKGILHRDLKPGNIMLGKYGETLVVDWGLAKSVERTEIPISDESSEIPVKRSSGGDSSPTLMGSALGTPAFMSPEQAAGRLDLLGPASDIYGLGATLYYVLTGQPPVATDDLADVLRRVQAGDFPRPRQIKPTIDPPLEAVALKAMSREPTNRYVGTAALRKDLENWIADAPVSAWPEPLTVRARRVLSRHRVLAAMTVAALVVAVAFLGVLARMTSNANEKLANLANDEKTAKLKAETERESAEVARAEADSQRQRAEKALLDSDWQLYVRNIALAQSAWNENNVPLMYRYLDACRWDFRGWEHNYLFTLANKNQVTLRGHIGLIMVVSFSADGKRVFTADQRGLVKVWDATTGKDVHAFQLGQDFTPGPFSDDCKWIIGQKLPEDNEQRKTPGEVKVWNIASGQETVSLKGLTSQCFLSFSPDARRIVSDSGGTIQVWNAITGEELLAFTDHGPLELWFSADSKLLNGLVDNFIKTWDATTGKEKLAVTLKGYTGLGLGRPCLSGDRKRLASASDQGTIAVWDVATGEQTLTLKSHDTQIGSFYFDNDGKRIAGAGQDGMIQLWDATTGRLLSTFRGHAGAVTSIAFGPDNDRIVSGSSDQTVKLWNAKTDHIPLHFKWTTDARLSSFRALSEDTKRVATTSSDNAVQVWDATTGQELCELKGHTDFVTCLAFGRDGTRIASGSSDKTVKVWDATTGRHLITLLGHAAEITRISLSPDGKQIVSSSVRGDKGYRIDPAEVKVWDLATGLQKHDLQGHVGITSLAFSGDSKRVVSGDYNGSVKVWDTTTGQKLFDLKKRVAHRGVASFDADNKRIVFFSMPHSSFDLNSGDPTLTLWDATTGKEIDVVTLAGHTKPVSDAVLSPDGKRIMTAGEDKTIRIWRATTGQELLTIKGEAVAGIGFSRDGKSIMNVNWNGDVEVRDATFSQWPLTIREQKRYQVNFSDDGMQILGSDGGLKSWDATTGKESFAQVAEDELVGLPGATFAPFAFSGDGKRVVFGGIRSEKLNVLDAITSKNRITLNGHTGIATCAIFSDDGKRIVSGGQDKTLRIWDATTGQELLMINGLARGPSFLSISPDGKTIVSGEDSSSEATVTIKLWDATTGHALRTFESVSSESEFSFSPNSKRFVIFFGGFVAPPRTAKIWDVATGEEVSSFEGVSIFEKSASFSPDSKRIASGEWHGFIKPSEVKVRDADSGRVLLSLKGNLSGVNDVEFSPDGKLLVSAGRDHTVRVWDSQNGGEIAIFYGHRSNVRCASFSPDGKRIVSCDDGGTIKVWNSPTNKKVGRAE